MKAADFDFIRNFIRTQTAIVIEPGKEYMVESRLEALARKEKFSDIDSFISHIRASPKPDLLKRVVDSMTTNETSFYRDIHPFEALRTTLLPELIRKRATERQINFWCGAASTGQECYSVLMTIAETCPEIFRWRFTFMATDLSREVLAKAQSGKYSQLEVNRGLPASMLAKYFTRDEDQWEIKPELRSHVLFREMNLIGDWPAMPMMDLIFMRNVLIYFDIETKRAILSKIRKVLRPDGYLFLGGAETTLNLDDNFERVVIQKTTCYKLKPT
jgi:chemotaxis protein methyltransferase CheR